MAPDGSEIRRRRRALRALRQDGLCGGALKTTSDNVFHQQCFRCTKCSSASWRQLLRGTVTGRLYCKPHFHQLFAAARDSTRRRRAGSTRSACASSKRRRHCRRSVEQMVGSAVWVEVWCGARRPLTTTLTARRTILADARTVELGDEVRQCALRAPTAARHRHAQRVYRADLGGARVNNLQLLQLNEPNLLYNIKSRFEARPDVHRSSSCSPSTHTRRSKGCTTRSECGVTSAATPPTTRRAHTSLSPSASSARCSPTTPSAESVVVSGESGAGKTETNKHLIAYLRWRCRGARGGRRRRRAGGDRVARAPISNVVLEALGNAATANNTTRRASASTSSSASRRAGDIHGATFRVFLFEKSRVAARRPRAQFPRLLPAARCRRRARRRDGGRSCRTRDASSSSAAPPSTAKSSNGAAVATPPGSARA